MNLLGDKLYNITNDKKLKKKKKGNIFETENSSNMQLYSKKPLFEKQSMRLMKNVMRSQSARKDTKKSFSVSSTEDNAGNETYFKQKEPFLAKRVKKNQVFTPTENTRIPTEGDHRAIPQPVVEKKFLPFTGVDQAFLINRPIFTREMSFLKEKLNEMPSLFNP
jgi:hypothetical protein